VADIKNLQPVGESADGGEQFKNLLSEAIDKVESYRQDATAKVERLLSGESEDLHNVALATQRAELTFELFLQTKNKVVQAYQEIMRMQV